MKTSLSWLHDYLGTTVAAELAEQSLMNLGFPIETREEVPGLSGPDTVLDVEVTSNRPDCLHHVGVARELAAAVKAPVKLPDCSLPPAALDPTPVAQLAALRLEDPEACPVYTARVIRGVKVGPSPAWLAQRLETLGLRSVNNVVDITNYVMLEMGQPLHAFDLAKLADKTIVVRSARDGETFVAIDSSKHTLKKGMLVIADAARPVAIAGVMGGLDSEVGHATVDVLLESALFQPLSVRRTSRALKLKSDASYRFERGIDPLGVEIASRRAARLIVELAGGKIAEGVLRAGQQEPAAMQVQLRPARCNAVLGLTLPPAEMVDLLARLGLQPVLQGEAITCTVPPYRLDLKKEIDLIEEVARLGGYHRLLVGEKIDVITRAVQPAIAAQRVLRGALVALGYYETINFSFIAPAQGQPFVPAGCEAVLIDDDRRKKEPMLRPSILPSLLICRKGNQDAGNGNIRVFETASTWLRREGKVVESRRLGLLADVPENTAPESALRELRGALVELTFQLTGQPLQITPETRPGCAAAATCVCQGKTLGWYGLASADLQKQFELQNAVLLAEIELDPLVAGYPPARRLEQLPRFPGIERDISIVVDETLTWAQVEAEARGAKPALLEDLRFVTTYRGKPIPAGKKSVTLRLIFRDPQTTLRHEQVDPQVAVVTQRLCQSLGAELRK